MSVFPLYDILGVASTATAKELKYAYYRKARECHPDKGGNAEDFKRLVKAYSILCDEEAKDKYDGSLGETDDGADKDALTTCASLSDELRSKFEKWCESYAEPQPETPTTETDLPSTELASKVKIIKVNLADELCDLMDLFQVSSQTFDSATGGYPERLEASVCNEDYEEVVMNLRLLPKEAIIAVYEKLTQNNPLTDYPRCYQGLLLLLVGRIAHLGNNIDRAVKCYQKAMLLNPLLIEAAVDLFQIGYRHDLSVSVYNVLPTFQLRLPALTHSEKLVHNKYIRSLLVYQTHIAELTDNLEKAYSYLNMLAIAQNSSVVASCLTLACYHFLHELQSCNKDNIRYALNKLLVTVLPTLYQIGLTRCAPPYQLSVFLSVLQLTVYANSLCGYVVSDFSLEVVQKLPAVILPLSQSVPYLLPVSLPSDSLYTELIFNKHYALLLSVFVNDLLVANWLREYRLFEGTWFGWFGRDFQASRLATMKALLEEEDKAISNVLSWQMNVKNGYHKLVGMVVSANTYSVHYLLEKEGVPLFSLEDIAEVVQRNVTNSVFTLDQHRVEGEYLKASPLQEMKYAPANLRETHFLATLLNTDYLLKMFTMDVNIETQYPFALTDKYSGRLPREILAVLSKFRNQKQKSNCHRFWIEAGDLEYETIEEEGKTTYLFGDVKMSVKTHLMIHNKDGQLVDAPEPNDGGVEQELAQAFTEHYAKLARIYPQFARLAEMVKMQAVTQLLHKLMPKEPLVDRKTIIDNLRAIYSGDEHYYELGSREKEYKALLGSRDQSTVTPVEKAELYAQIKAAHQDGKLRIREQLRTQLREDFPFLKKYKLDLDDFFKLRAEVSRKNLIRDVFQWLERAKKYFFENTGLGSVKQVEGMGLELVPSGFARRDGLQVYGGVNLQCNVVKATYKEGVRTDGRHAYTIATVNTCTQVQHVSTTGSRASDFHQNTQQYWAQRHTVANDATEHTTLHKATQRNPNGIYHVHKCDGTLEKTRY